jgi:phosphoglycerate dehydrogenase-like enzyme
VTLTVRVLLPWCEQVGLPKEELVKIIGDYDGLVVRSATKVTNEVIRAGKKLVVIGRAGQYCPSPLSVHSLCM